MSGPEQQRLMDRLFSDPERKIRNFKFTPGDKPGLTKEDLCCELNKAMDEVERRKVAGDFGDGPVRSGKPQVDLREWGKQFTAAT